MILDHFWKMVFILALCAAGIAYYFKNKEVASAHESLATLASLIDPKTNRPGTPLDEFESNVYRAIATLNLQIAEGRGSLEEILEQACEASGIPDRRAQQMRSSFRELLDSCRDAKVFDGPGGRNQKRLEVGRSPKITEGTFRGEHLVVAYKIPPIFAEEAARSFCNVMLVPESARALSDLGLAPDTVVTASILRNAGIISPTTFERIDDAHRSAAR
ncbi:hypothetical protein BH23VER1_BH23VER1_12320 [soil metagenome]